MAVPSCGERQFRLEKHLLAKLFERMGWPLIYAHLLPMRTNAGSDTDSPRPIDNHLCDSLYYI